MIEYEMLEYMVKELAIDGYNLTTEEVKTIITSDGVDESMDPVVVEYVFDMLNEWNNA